MRKEDAFEEISIMGRVIYIILAIEIYLKEKAHDENWDRLLDALWSFPEFNGCIDDYAYKVIECTPESILDEREDFKTFEYFSEDVLYEFKVLYTRSACTETVNYLMEQINEILAYNLYTSVEPPEPFSLKIINNTYQYIKKILGEKKPPIEPFRIYSVYEEKCWGNYTLGKERLFVHLNNG